jgi:hypothetical protein
MLLKPAIMEEVEEFDATERAGEGGCRRGNAGTAKTFCDCNRPMGLVLPADLGTGGGRIFKCACSKLIGFDGDGLSGTERTEAAWDDIVTRGRLSLPGVCGLVNVAVVITLGSLRFTGGTERATEGGLLGAALDGARAI